MPVVYICIIPNTSFHKIIVSHVQQMSSHLKKCFQQFLLAPSEFFIPSKVLWHFLDSPYRAKVMVKGQTMAIGAYCIHYVYFGSPFAYALYIRFGLSKKKRVKEQTIGISFNGIFLLQYIHKTINFPFTLNLCMLAHSCKKNKITYYLSSSIFSKHFSWMH